MMASPIIDYRFPSSSTGRVSLFLFPIRHVLLLAHLFVDAAASASSAAAATATAAAAVVVFASARLAALLIGRLLVDLLAGRRDRNDPVAIAAFKENDTRRPAGRLGFPVEQDILQMKQ